MSAQSAPTHETRIAIETLCDEYLDLEDIEKLAQIPELSPIVAARASRARYIFNKYAHAFVRAIYLRVYKQTINWELTTRPCISFEDERGTTIMPRSNRNLHVVQDIGIFSDIPFSATIRFVWTYDHISAHVESEIISSNWIDRGRDCPHPYFIKLGLKTMANPLPYFNGIYIFPYEKWLDTAHAEPSIEYVIFGGKYRSDPHNLEIYPENLLMYNTRRIVRERINGVAPPHDLLYPPFDHGAHGGANLQHVALPVQYNEEWYDEDSDEGSGSDNDSDNDSDNNDNDSNNDTPAAFFDSFDS